MFTRLFKILVGFVQVTADHFTFKIQQAQIITGADAAFAGGLLLIHGVGAAIGPTLAGVVMAVPYFREHFTPAAIDEANRCNLPLLELPWEVPFSEITHDVLARIINLQAEIIRRSDLIHRTLTSAAIDANNLQGLAVALTRALERSATVVSADGTVLGASQADCDELHERALMSRLQQHGSLNTIFNSNAPVLFDQRFGFAQARLGGPVRLGGDVIGVVWLAGATHAFEELDSRALEHASVIAALHLTHQRELSDALDAAETLSQQLHRLSEASISVNRDLDEETLYQQLSELELNLILDLLQQAKIGRQQQRQSEVASLAQTKDKFSVEVYEKISELAAKTKVY